MTARTSDQANLVTTPSLKAAVGFVDEIISNREGLFLLTGPTVICKSTVLQYCRARSAEHAIVLVHELRRVDGDNLSALLNEVFAVESATNRGSNAQALRYFLKLGTLRSKGKRFILVLEDVEEIHSSGSELIRALLQMKAQEQTLVTIILSGQLQLDALLDRTYRWGLQKLITDSHQMTPVSVAEADPLIDEIPALRGGSPIPFRRGAKKLLVQLSRGLPGSILSLGSRAANIARRTNARAVTKPMVRGAAVGDYRSGFDLLAGSALKLSLAVIVLLAIPIVLFRQGLSPNSFSERPIGGVQSTNTPVAEPEQSTPAQSEPVIPKQLSPTPVSKTPTLASSPTPTPMTREDGILVSLTPAYEDATESLPATDSPTPRFVIETSRLRIPSWDEIQLQQFSAFNLEIPSETP